MKKIVFAILALMLLVACGGKKKTSYEMEYSHQRSDTVDMAGSLIDAELEISKEKRDAKKVAAPASSSRSNKYGNMRGWDPASEDDDMDDNGMDRYMENYDDEGWD